MPKLGWKTPAAGLSGVVISLMILGGQCGGPSPTATPSGPTQTATAILPTPPPMSTNVPANVNAVQQTMGQVVTVVQDLRGRAQSLTPDQERDLASSMSIFLSQLANFAKDLQPALAPAPGGGQEQALSVIDQMKGTVQQMAAAASPGTPTPAPPGPTAEPTAPGAPTAGPTSTPTSADKLMTLTTDINAVSNQMQSAQVRQILPLLNDLVSEMNQLVNALVPTLKSMTAEQTFTLELDAQDLQASSEAMLAGLTGATPVASPTR